MAESTVSEESPEKNSSLRTETNDDHLYSTQEKQSLFRVLQGEATEEQYEAWNQMTAQPRRQKWELPKHLLGLMGEVHRKMANHNHQEAIDLCLELIRLAPCASKPYETLQMLYDEEGLTEKGTEVLYLCAHLKRTDSNMWVEVADRLLAQNNPRKATQCLTQAVRHADNKRAVILMERKCQLYEEIGDMPRALTGYTQMLTLIQAGPENDEKYLNLARRLCETYHSMCRTNDAARVLATMFQMRPSLINSDDMNKLLDLRMTMNQYQACLERSTDFKMYDMPVSLQECCVDFICDNLAELCDQQSLDSKQSKLVFKDSEVCFHADLSEQLLASLCEKGKLNDETLALFDSECTTLRRVSIHNAQVTLKGLRVLKTHRISELEITGLKGVTVNDVIGCLGEWTLSNLRMLNVSNNMFLNTAQFCVVVALSKLRNLHSLNVSATEFNKHGLEIIAEDLPCLESLDISCTPISDIAPLRKCKHRLKVLSLYNLVLTNSETVAILCELHQLRHLDLSADTLGQAFVRMQPQQFMVTALLEQTKAHPSMKSLDISGREEVVEKCLISYLDCHPSLRFLGLALTKACEYPVVSDEAMDQRDDTMVSGEGSLRQIMESLRRYTPRAVFVQKTLFKLFGFSSGLAEPRQDIIKAVLPGMKKHPRQLGVQMAATACLYNLTKGELGPKIHPSCLMQVIAVTLDAMENFPNHQQLQKNALLTLCSDRILQDISFDRYRCAQLVVECLCTFEESSMNRMSVAICSILAAKISTEQTSSLGSRPRYMKKLLQLVKGRMDTRIIDITLKFTLSALWNLTDESPPTCSVFLGEKGLELFMMMLQMLEEVDNDSRMQVETKILGLLNNIAEVKSLRHELMREDFIMLVKRLLHTRQIDVSYFAAGIIAHLASDGEEAWRGIAGKNRDDILEELSQVVLAWEQPQGEMVAYRSFSPFFPLLDCFDTPSVQLWALWAIQHVCTRNGDRYCPLLNEEGGVEKIQRLKTTYSEDMPLSKISANILDKLAETGAEKPKTEESN